MIIKKIDLHQADIDFIEKYLDFRDILHRSYYSVDIQKDRKIQKHESKVIPSKLETKMNYFAIENKKILGQASYFASNSEIETNPDLCELYIEVHPEYLNRGIAKSLLKMLLKAATDNFKSKVSIWIRSDNNAANKWMDKLQIKSALIESVNRLYRNEINYDFIRSNIDKLVKSLSKYTLEFYDKISYRSKIMRDDEFANQITDFHNEVGNLIPREELDINDFVMTISDVRSRVEIRSKSKTKYNLFVLSDHNKIIAISETYYFDSIPVKFLGTGLTGVRELYHRKGIATLLKIKMILYIMDNFPDFVYLDTENAHTNIGMISINNRLGFKKVYSYYEYLTSLESLISI